MVKYLDEEGLKTLVKQIRSNTVSSVEDTTITSGAIIGFSHTDGTTTLTDDGLVVGTNGIAKAGVRKDGVYAVDDDQYSTELNSKGLLIDDPGGSSLKVGLDGITKSSGSANEMFTTNGGTIKTGTAKGNIPVLDNGGKLPVSTIPDLATLGLDTTPFIVVNSLPTSIRDIQKKIYICPRGASGLTSDTTKPESGTPEINKYTEWLYTGEVGDGADITYDEKNWEKLGEHDFNHIDLSSYYTKTQADETFYTKSEAPKYILFNQSPNSGSGGAFLQMQLSVDQYGHGGFSGDIPNATSSLPGLMSERDKTKLDNISTISTTDIEGLFNN